MKHFLFFCLTCSLLSQVHDMHPNTDEKKVFARGCSHWVFFTEFLWVLNHLEWCIRNNLTPDVCWDANSAYYSPLGYNGSLNPWEYYFEPVSSVTAQPDDPISFRLAYQGNFTTIWDYAQYIMNQPLLPPQEQLSCISITEKNFPILPAAFYTTYPIPFGNKHLYDPSFRRYVKEKLIDPFIKIKPSIMQKIETFWTTTMKDKKNIGIHLRGNFIFNEVFRVPDEILFNEANKYVAQGYQIFVATDQIALAEKAQQALHGQVIMYDCSRAMNPTSPYLPQQLIPQQGEDVLIEALLLSRCDHFIHTLSQVSTAVLYFNPELSHTLFY